MPKTRKIEHQLVKEFRKLTPEGKGEVLQYTKWMRDAENQEKTEKKIQKQNKNNLCLDLESFRKVGKRLTSENTMVCRDFPLFVVLYMGEKVEVMRFSGRPKVRI